MARKHHLPRQPAVQWSVCDSQDCGTNQPKTHFHIALAGYEICAIAHQRLDWKPGDALKLSPVIDRVHLFDAETKVALPAG